SFYRPLPINGFVKVLDYFARPVSLCLRLFGNILGGFIVMNLLYYAFPIVAPALVGVYFDLFDGALQAYVFVFLTMIFLQEASETE
ncbi:MAG: F0F1 ATP synthase subunit A, partial [Spirochaetaceae bacterium]|nr:F0F1 ATP synthase subunit A [Spirochaetaceae bacterium]